jgi:CO dehydrogenase maturation factor
VGKGGSGKTTIAGTLARILARRNKRILAIDGDPNPNLALSLGLARDSADAIRAIPSSVIESIPAAQGPATLRLSMPREAVLSEFGAEAPDGIRLIVMGKPPDGSAGSGCMCASHRAVRGLIAELTDCGDHTITDMEAGLEHLKRGTARNVEAMLVVVEPYYRSLEAGSRTFSLARELGIPHLYAIANKIHDPAEREAVSVYCREHAMPIIGEVPFERAFGDAEVRGESPFEHAPSSAGVRAIEGIADRLSELEQAPVAA